jgi:hypothetical protein
MASNRERCGDAAKSESFKPAKPGPQLQDGAVPQFGRTRAADDAGLSERQRKTPLRVANVPESNFEEAIESEDPATVTNLAQIGKKTYPAPPDAPSSTAPAEAPQ